MGGGLWALGEITAQARGRAAPRQPGGSSVVFGSATWFPAANALLRAGPGRQEGGGADARAEDVSRPSLVPCQRPPALLASSRGSTEHRRPLPLFFDPGACASLSPACVPAPRLVLPAGLAESLAFPHSHRCPVFPARRGDRHRCPASPTLRSCFLENLQGGGGSQCGRHC